jgi:hypothetical protein
MDFTGDGVVASKGNNSHDHAFVFQERLIPDIASILGIGFQMSLGYRSSDFKVFIFVWIF